jgi:RNA polymerase sigma-70 factor (ECF subfamily)
LAPWLYTIARRVTIDLYRRERRVAVPTVLDEEPAVEPGAAPSLEHLWEAWEVRLAIAKLPAEEAEVVRLAHFMGLTHREIADKLELPLGTVKSRSARAHSRLAGLLAHVVNVAEP